MVPHQPFYENEPHPAGIFFLVLPCPNNKSDPPIRDSSEFVQPHVPIKATDVLTVVSHPFVFISQLIGMQVRDPIMNELDERFVLVRTSSGAEGYVQVRHVVRAPSSSPALTDASRGKGSKLSANVPAAATGSVSFPTKVGSSHFGEWRAVEERPTSGRYSARGDRIADINKCFEFPFCILSS